MRGTVAKRLRKEASRSANDQESKPSIKRMIKRFFTGKVDENGERVIISENRDTVVYTGFRRIYQDMKRDHRRAA